ncbi:MAG: peptidoglycan DD-metalloendopeptidase family protein [Aeromonas sp.]
MRSSIWQGGSVLALSWLLLACSTSEIAAPVDGVGDDQFVSTIPVRDGGSGSQSGGQRTGGASTTTWTETEIPTPPPKWTETEVATATRTPSHTTRHTQTQASTPVRAPIDGDRYVVKPGDTLYSIAFNSGNDVPSLADLNGISAPYAIHPGQQLRLNASSADTAATATATATATKPAVTKPASAHGSANRSASSYEVRPGDTLSSIGRQFGITAPMLAQMNHLSAPYALQPGQRINVDSADGGASHVVAVQHPAPAVVKPPVKVTPPVVSRPSTTPRPLAEPSTSGESAPFIAKKSVAAPAPKEYAQEKAQKSSTSSSKLAWHWPAQGRIVQGFSVAEQGNKGIDIAGKKGQPVYATSGGKVVYAGSALRGYGKLIIIKHDDDYLSAYAHNDSLRVKEGDSVKGGAVIADMGDTDAPDVRLHFEIRYRGKSINPMSYLPKR